jgi:aspartate aminotransferase-like enzyme
MKLFTPGPVAMDPETKAVSEKQPLYFRTPEFSHTMLECEKMLKVILDVPEDGKVIFLTASGTAAMEASVMNFFSEKDTILVISGGSFGERFKQICEIHRIPVEVIYLKWKINLCEYR